MCEVENPAQSAIDLWDVGASFEAIIVLVDAVGKLAEENASLRRKTPTLKLSRLASATLRSRWRRR